MFRRKIVMKVDIKCKKCQTKALKVAAGKDDVDYVGLDGEAKDKVVVIGEVDPVELAKSLRRKMGGADIISVAPVT